MLTTRLLLSQPRSFSDLFPAVTVTAQRTKGPDQADVWGQFWPRIKVIEQRHREHDDAETPRLPDAVLHGTRRLLRSLEDSREIPPTIMTGTCDGTITFEWHNLAGSGGFRSLDVLNENEAEEFLTGVTSEDILRLVTF